MGKRTKGQRKTFTEHFFTMRPSSKEQKEKQKKRRETA